MVSDLSNDVLKNSCNGKINNVAEPQTMTPVLKALIQSERRLNADAPIVSFGLLAAVQVGTGSEAPRLVDFQAGCAARCGAGSGANEVNVVFCAFLKRRLADCESHVRAEVRCVLRARRLCEEAQIQRRRLTIFGDGKGRNSKGRRRF